MLVLDGGRRCVCGSNFHDVIILQNVPTCAMQSVSLGADLAQPAKPGFTLLPHKVGKSVDARRKLFQLGNLGFDGVFV